MKFFSLPLLCFVLTIILMLGSKSYAQKFKHTPEFQTESRLVKKFPGIMTRSSSDIDVFIKGKFVNRIPVTDQLNDQCYLSDVVFIGDLYGDYKAPVFYCIKHELENYILVDRSGELHAYSGPISLSPDGKLVVVGSAGGAGGISNNYTLPTDLSIYKFEGNVLVAKFNKKCSLQKWQSVSNFTAICYAKDSVKSFAKVRVFLDKNVWRMERVK